MTDERASAEREVEIAVVDRALATAWSAESAARPRIATIVSVLRARATPDREAQISRALAEVGAIQRARVILVVTASGSTNARAEVALLRDRTGKASGESIRVTAPSFDRGWIEATVAPWVDGELPLVLWSPDGVPLHDAIDFGARRTVSVVDLAAIALGDLPAAIARAIAWTAHEGRILGDLTWQRLRIWQDLVARFFDDPRCVGDLDDPRRLRMRFAAGRGFDEGRVPIPIAVEPLLFASWLSTQLGFAPESWLDVGTARLRRGDAQLTLLFEPAARTDLPEGALVEVELTTGTGRYRVHRDDDPRVVCWEGDRAGTPMPDQCLRIDSVEETALLSRIMERAAPDGLLERSFGVLAKLLEARRIGGR